MKNNQCVAKVFDYRLNRFKEDSCNITIGFRKEGARNSYSLDYYYDKREITIALS